MPRTINGIIAAAGAAAVIALASSNSPKETSIPQTINHTPHYTEANPSSGSNIAPSAVTEKYNQLSRDYDARIEHCTKGGELIYRVVGLGKFFNTVYFYDDVGKLVASFEPTGPVKFIPIKIQDYHCRPYIK